MVQCIPNIPAQGRSLGDGGHAPSLSGVAICMVLGGCMWIHMPPVHVLCTRKNTFKIMFTQVDTCTIALSSIILYILVTGGDLCSIYEGLRTRVA